MGKVDSYDKNETTTTAMGEGAIEGTAADYEVQDKYSTAFAYSRFGKKAAAPRNVGILKGKMFERNADKKPFAGW